MSIILLRGFSHSGKDYVGQILCNNYGFKRFAFADSLKSIVSIKYNCTKNILHSQEGKLKICENDLLKRTYRQILIDEALELRNQDAGIFAKHCCEEIKSLNCNKVVITDWRYPNELDIVTKFFPKYKITTAHILRTDLAESPVKDISEYHLVNRSNDFTILNRMDDTIFDEVDKLLNFIN